MRSSRAIGSLPIIQQWIDGSEAAQEKNIKATPKGVVKILDVGLAKASGGASC